MWPRLSALARRIMSCLPPTSSSLFTGCVQNAYLNNEEDGGGGGQVSIGLFASCKVLQRLTQKCWELGTYSQSQAFSVTLVGE